MIDKYTSLLNGLQETLDLTEYEAKAYLSLIVHDSMTVSEISRTSGVPRPKCYEVLKGLASKGLIGVVATKPVKYEALQVEKGLMNRISQLKSELLRKERETLSLVQELKEIQNSGPTGRTIKVMLLEDPDSIISSSVTDASRAREEVLIAMTRTPVKFGWIHNISLLKGPVLKGVRYKFIVPSISSFTGKVMSKIRLPMKDSPVEVRACERLKQPFSVIDERISYLYITDPNRGVFLSAIKIEDNVFGSQMREMFYWLWENCGRIL